MNASTSITGRLKQQNRTRESSASLRVSELVPDRPLPEWILQRIKGKRSGHQSTELRQYCNPRGGVEKPYRSPSMIGSTNRPLDLNNMRKDWKSSSAKRYEVIGRARISQNRRPEPVQPFPGEIRPRSISSESPVTPFIQRSNVGIRQSFGYPDGLEGTNARPSSTDESADTHQGIHPQILMDKTFLTLDQSKLPLEMFDFVEASDRLVAPSSWLATGAKAMAPYFLGNKWQLKHCSVLSFDAGTNKYHIRFSHNEQEKSVKRFNLLFGVESRELWQTRRARAKEAREAAKRRLRFDYFISQQPMEEVRAVQGSTIRGIHEKVADGLPLDVIFPQQGTLLGHLVRDLTKQVIQQHSRSMKKSILFYKLKHFEAERQRYHRLGLGAVPAPAPIPWSSKVDIPGHSFSERQKAIGNIHYSSLPEVLGALLCLHQVWERNFVQERLVDTRLENLELPCKVENFCETQSRCCARLGERLAQDWRQAFSEQFVDFVQDVYDFFQSDAQLYSSSALFRLLKHLELRMNSQLRIILTDSLLDWRELVRRNTPDAAEMDLDALEAQGSTPLFDVRLQVVTGEDGKPCVLIVPSLPAIEHALMHIMDDMIAAVKDLATIDADVMSLLRINSRPILNMGDGDNTYAELESLLSATSIYTRERVLRGMQGTICISTKYSKYCYLMTIDTEEFVYSFIEARPAPTEAEYFDKIREMHNASVAIENCSVEYELFKLVRVDTSEATKVLRSKALEIRNALLDALVSQAREQNNGIIAGYEAILTRIAEKPTTEADLAALREFISDSKEKVAHLMQEVQRIHARVDILVEFNYSMCEEDIRLSWRTMDYPTMVDHAANEAEEALEVDKVRMMDKLALEMETFEEILERFEMDIAQAKQCGDFAQMDANADYVNSIKDAICDAKAKAEDFNSREKVFGFPPTEYHILDKVEMELDPFYTLWNMISDFHAKRKEWLHGSFLDLNGADIERDVTDWWKNSYRLSKSLEDNFPAPSLCAAQLREDTTAFREHLPVIQALASPALKARHWKTLSEKSGNTIEPDEELTLQQLVDTNVGQYIETIHEVCMTAEKEYGLEKALAAMKDEWASLEFEVRPYKETYLVSGVDDILNLLDDHIVKTQTMRGSPYIFPIEAECKAWEFRLKYAQGLVDEWINCQRTWLYLEPIFSSEDIMRQLPTEARRFNSVDQLWKKTMEDTNKDPNFMAQAESDKKLEDKLRAANQKLEEIQKGLSDYLEMKRMYFPRFFFLSNEELLEILSQTKEPRAVQPHLNKAFEGIASCNFEADLKITQMVSAEGETVVLDSAVDPESAANKGNVERWLLELENMQWQSVRTQVMLSLEEYPKISREEWVLNWPAQAILGVSQMDQYPFPAIPSTHEGLLMFVTKGVFWAQEVATSIKNGGVLGLSKMVQTLNRQLRSITMLVRGRLSSLERRTLGALCTIDVHARDTVVKLIEAEVSHEDDFDWMSQLRYYWVASWKEGQAIKKGDSTLVARIVNAKCLYGYEYLGNTMRLVITPLTDRCYRTMIGAIGLLYGGAPEGPAGTGKTETVKDLSKAVAIQCVVFNCSDGLDYIAMAKFFKGLAGCGSWCCFDEFNRINIEVLSVIAQQILTINKAKKAGVDKFHFEGTFMKINANANAFITMNPGYAGRAELPDNLKALFRPCAMMVPDYSLISEIRLYSFGFENARENAQKLVRVLQLCSEQLSSQKHYDYGMRAVNSILVAAGNLRQQLGDDPNWSEARLVLRSVNDINLPKFTVEDLPLFKGITSDLFPGVELGESNHGALLESIEAVCAEGISISAGQVMKLLPKPSWRQKVIQLYEMVLVRHGVMIVGQAGSGKTTTVHTLSNAMSRCCEDGSSGFVRVQVHTMNPKSISSGQLYGNFDESTHEWSDGILAVIYRNCSKDTSIDRKWLMFDGPVDAVWIENMNTVLDDNKKLCLMSGEIVKMSDSMTMMFEAEDLEQASPATVSRVGMIFCEIRNLDWQPLRDVWLDSLPVTFGEYRPLIVGLFDWLFPAALYFVQKYCVIPTPVTSQSLLAGWRGTSKVELVELVEVFVSDKVMVITAFRATPAGIMSFEQELAASLIRLFGVFLDSPDGFASDMTKVLECLFVKSLMWSVGACVDTKGRQAFGHYTRMVMEGKGLEGSDAHQDFLLKNRTWNARDRPIGLLPPDDGRLLYDFRFDAKKGQWQTWLDAGERFVIPRDASFNNIVVPTMDTVRNDFLITNLIIHGHHVLCTGGTGTGKSVTVKKKLLFGMGLKFRSIMLNFSAQTSANQTQDIIDSKLDKRRKGVLGPPLGMTCVIFVDDLNMPAKETYGAQPPIEILRQWMDHGGWHDRKENTFRQLVDVQFVAAMGPPGGGRTSITQRYVRHFNILNFVAFSTESLQRVFGTILEWFLQRGFNSSVKQVASSMVASTLDIYDTIADNLLPTPAKSHYTFNLRDLSKVFQGVLQGSANLIYEKEQFVRLWVHECLRIFHDRLVDESDRIWFWDLIKEKVKTHFGLNYESSVRGNNELLIYGNFSDPKGSKVYQEMEDHEALLKTMEDYLEDHNAMTNKPMSLVLFENAIEHVARIGRIICQPMGNALLVGVGGSGRKSLTILAVSIADFKLFQIEISKSYGIMEWREDLKRVLTMSGVENRATVFVLDDTQVMNEVFLEDVNGILNTGEVPSLFNSEEMMALNEALTKPAQAVGINTGSPAEVYEFFVERVRSNLHIVLCLSPIGDAFRTRLRMFPSLVNCCTIDWFMPWPQEALKSVACHFLDAVDMEESIKAGVVDVCVDMQQRARNMAERYRGEMGRFYYVTPTSYLELINTFKNLLHRQRKSVQDRKDRYDNGLLKLADTENQVAQMQVDLEELQPKLKETTVATDALLVQIANDTEVANEKKVVVEKEEIICNSQAEESRALKSSCVADLAEALPALESAVSALKSLSKGDIVEVKAMKKPPAAVKLVMEAVCIMMGVKADKIKDTNGGTKKIDDYWGPAQKHLLSDSRFLQNLMDYDKDNMDSTMVERVKTRYTDDKDFDPDKVKKGSVAAAGLCKWVHAMVVYNRVAKMVAPKRAALAEAEATLAQAMAELGEKQAMLKDLMDKLEALEQQLQAAEGEKAALQDQVTDCGNKLRRAEQLISGLGGEKSSWARFSAELQKRYVNVTGDITLSSGVIAYMGAFTSAFREQAISQWARLLGASNIPCSENFRLETTLGDAVTIRGWVIDKLPNDSFSIDNAIMLFESNRWPLMIDPQGQANKWVKQKEHDNQLKVVRQNQANFVRTIENAIQFGSPVLLENVPESLDPVLEPVLLKQVLTVGGISTLKLGDNNVEYDPNFRLYISTKMSNPHYPPELCVKVNLLNFMATQEGLEDQMLGITVAKEETELEARREQLVLEDADNKRVQKEIEDTILDLLKNSEGNILDDEVLISTLAQSKVTSNIIERKVKEASKTQEIIAETRTGYIPIAFRASQLFFCISDLGTVDPMYQYSLEWFISLFESSIDKAPRAHVLEDRLRNLTDCFTAVLYKNVCRSLFEKHKLLFSFLLSVKIMQGEGRMNSEELRFFLQGATSLDLVESNPLANGSWLTDKTWSEIIAAGKLSSMSHFTDKFKSDLSAWESVFLSDDPLAEIEEVVNDTYNPFQKMCILRAIRPDTVVPAVQMFIGKEMGTSFIEPPPFDLRACYMDSTCSTPLIFVLTPGADPMTELLRVAEELGYGGKRLTSISLGQGQGPLAETAISEAAENGTWVCLQNCHLCISWMATLERLCQELTSDRVHDTFRLWLTSEPSPHFPSFILQNGVKMTNEPPKGMRANLLGSFYNIESDWFESCLRSNEFKKMLFGLVFFHAVVRERRKFGPLGWNIQYVFSGPDLRISMDQLRIFLDNLRPEDPLPYAALSYLAGECNYGGRVTDDKDRRCLVNILTDFYCPEILDDRYHFSPSGTYYAPPVGSKDDFVGYIKSLPFNEGPEVFGLHANANMSCALSETSVLLDTALSLQPRSSGGGGKSWDCLLGELAGDISERMPPLFDVERALLDFPVRYEESMNTVLTQELTRFNRLVNIISKALAEVTKAIKGLVVMSSELEQMGNSMVVGKVPHIWSCAAYPSLMPLGSWITDLLMRLDFLASWMKNGVAPTVFWLSGFFFTQAFITGTLQNFARKHKVPIDKAGFDFRVLTPLEIEEAETNKAEDGAYIRGLFIEGARMKIDIPKVKGSPELYTGETGGTSQVYMCPVYKTSVRQGTLSTTGHSTNFVMFITLPIAEEHSQKHWIKRGVAMLTQLDN